MLRCDRRNTLAVYTATMHNVYTRHFVTLPEVRFLAYPARMCVPAHFRLPHKGKCPRPTRARTLQCAYQVASGREKERKTALFLLPSGTRKHPSISPALRTIDPAMCAPYVRSCCRTFLLLCDQGHGIRSEDRSYAGRYRQHWCPRSDRNGQAAGRDDRLPRPNLLPGLVPGTPPAGAGSHAS